MRRLLRPAAFLCVVAASPVERRGRGVVVAVTGSTVYMDEAATNAAAFQGGQNVSIVLPDDNAELADACQHHNKIIGWRCVPVSRTRLVETLFVDSPRRDRASASLAALSAAIKAGSAGTKAGSGLRSGSEVLLPHIQARVYHIAARLASPYEDTIFLDADVYPCLSLERLWHKLDADLPGRSLLDVYDVLAVHEANSITRLKGIYDPAIPHEKTHGNKPTHLVPKAWPEINGGVMVFRRNDRSIEFLENWLADYIDNSRSVAHGQDQPTLRYALYNAVLAGMRFYPLPPIWNTRAWKPNLQGTDYSLKKQGEFHCCFDYTVIAAAKKPHELPRKEVSIILDHKCKLPAAVADYEGGPRYFPATGETEQYPKELPPRYH